MKIAAIIARVLLGLAFLVAGISGFFIINNPPPMPGLAGAFQDAFFRSRWVLYVDGIEVITGLLLLTGRFVPLALMMAAPILYNILVFHLTMMPMGIFPGLILTVCWAIVAYRFRSYLLPLLTRSAVPTEP